MMFPQKSCVQIIEKFISTGNKMKDMGNVLLVAQDTESIFKKKEKKRKTKEKKQTGKLDNMKMINIDKLTLESVNQNLFLDVIIILPPLKVESVMFLVVDSNDTVDLVAAYNYPFIDDDYVNIFQVGRRVKILNPYYKTGMYGSTLIRVDSSYNIIVQDIEYENLMNRVKKIVQILVVQSLGSAQHLLDSIKLNLPKFDNKQEQQFNQLKGQLLNQENLKATFIEESKNDCPSNDAPDWTGPHNQELNFDNLDPNQWAEQQELFSRNKDFITLSMISSNLYLEGKLEKVFEISQKMVAMEPNYAFLWYNLGEQAFQLGNYEASVAATKNFFGIHYRKKFSVSKIFIHAHYQLGFSFQYLKVYEMAKKYLLTALSYEPNNQTYLQALGAFYLEINELGVAEGLLLSVIQLYQVNNLDSKIETCRALSNLFKLATKKQNLNEIVRYARSIIGIDYASYDYVIYKIEELLFQENTLCLEKRCELYEILLQKEEFKILAENWILKMILYEQERKVRRQVYNRFYEQIDFSGLGGEKQETTQVDTIIEKTTEPIQSQFVEDIHNDVDKIDSNVLKVQEQADGNGENVLLEEVDKKIEQLLLSDIKPDQQFTQNEKTDSIKKLTTSQSYKHKQQFGLLESININLNFKTKFKGFIRTFEQFNRVYVICIDQKLDLDTKIFKKFQQACFKGLTIHKSGIRKTNYYYELIIHNYEYRLICDEESQTQKGETVLLFDQIIKLGDGKRILKK